MSDSVDFDIVCPNNHDQTVSFTRDEFEDSVKAEALVFHCNTCDTSWNPSREEIAKMRQALSRSAT